MVTLVRDLAASGEARAADLVARLDAISCGTSHAMPPLSPEVRLEDLVADGDLARDVTAALAAAAAGSGRPEPVTLADVAVLTGRQILMAPGGCRRVLEAVQTVLAAAGLSLAVGTPPPRPKHRRTLGPQARASLTLVGRPTEGGDR